MKKVAFFTLGCKVNQYETNAMEQQFLEAGYDIVDFDEFADIYIVNTCTVTSVSDKKSRQVLRRAKGINPEAIVVAVGCYAQVGKKELEKIEEIDLILGNNEKKDIFKYIEKNINNKKTCVSEFFKNEEFCEFGTVTHLEKTRAVIKVQDGCDRFCSYCIIPYARGRVRSRKIENVIEEITSLAKNGVKEVIITGIHVASYGKDFRENIGLIDLLEKINEIDKIERIRLGSIEPTLIDENFLSRLKKLEKICHHFHLSLQSGNNDTLKRMNRRYTIEEFKKAIDLLRNTYSDVILTTDIIVGFPGETEEEFNLTYKFLEDINFYKMHVFKYSKREGTKAAIMENQVDSKIKDIRSKKLIELSNKNQYRYNKSYIGKEVEIIVEECNKNILNGHTQNYIFVEAEGKARSNEKIKVRIFDADIEQIMGKTI